MPNPSRSDVKLAIQDVGSQLDDESGLTPYGKSLQTLVRVAENYLAEQEKCPECGGKLDVPHPINCNEPKPSQGCGVSKDDLVDIIHESMFGIDLLSCLAVIRPDEAQKRYEEERDKLAHAIFTALNKEKKG